MAGVYKGLTVKIGADTTGLSSALNRIDSQTRGLKREMRSIDKALRLDPKSTELARQKMEAYQKEIASASDRLKTLKDAESQIGKEGMSSKAWDTLQRDIAATESDLNRLTSEYRAFTAEQAAASSGLGKVGAALTDVGERLDPIAGKMQTAGTVMSATITAPMVAAGTVAVKKAMDFETSLAKVSTLADESVVSMEEMGDGARRLAVDYGKSASEINEALYQAMSASVDTADAVGFVETSTRLAKAGFTESATAVDVLTTAMNAYGLEAEDAAHIADVLVNTQNLGKTTVDELAASMGNVIPTAAAYNVDLHNLAASYAVMTKQGINTANATTAINGMLTELADSGSTVNGVLQDMTGRTFGQLMSDGASLGDVIGMLSDAVGGNSEEFANLWGNVRASRGALAIANAGVDEFNGTLESMTAASGTVDEALGKLGDTTGASLAKAKAAVDDAAISVGQVLLPYVEMAAGVVKDAADAFNSLSDEEKEQVVRTAAVAASIGPVLLLLSKAMAAIGTVGKGISSLAKGFAALDLATNGTAKGFKAAAKAGEDMAGKAMASSVAMGAAKAAAIGLAMVGIALLVSAISDAIQKQQTYTKATDGLRKAALGATGEVKGMSDAISGVNASSAAKSIDELAEAQAKLADEIVQRNTEVANQSAIMDAYGDVIEELAGKANLSEEDVARLKTAVDRLNESLGTEMRVEIDEDGRYQVMEGDAIRAKEAIEELIAVKQAEMRMDAAAQGYEDAMAAEAEAAKKVADARQNATDKYNEYLDMRKRAEEGDAGAALAAEDLYESYQELNEAVGEAEELQKGAADATSYMNDTMTLNQMAIDAGAGSLASWVASNQDVIASVQSGGNKVVDFTKDLEAAGVTTERLASLSSEKSAYIATAYNGTSASVSDAFRRVGSVSDETFAQVWESCRGNTTKVEQELARINGIGLDDKEIRVVADTSNFWAQIEDLRSKNIYIPVVTNLAAQRATGGLSPKEIKEIPRHADGGINGIVTRATLTNVGLVGEAGDEAVLHMSHAGGAIIPLSDRRHVRPFAQAVAAEMGAAGGATYDNRRTYQIGDITVPPGSAAAEALEALVTALDIEDRS